MFKNRDEKLISKLPFGFRDVFPVEAYERKFIEEIIREIFISWGYGEVKTPVVEFTKNISAGVGKDWKDRLISFFDNDGNLVSLRADMTIPIARLTGMRIRPEQLPVRFFYIANSFRQSSLQKGQKRVLSQAGLELIGTKEFYADAEVMIVLINILEKLEIKDFKIGVGHIKLIEGICEWFGLSAEEYKVFKANLISSNLVYLKEFLAARDTAKATLFMDLLEPSNKIESLENMIKKIKNEKVFDSFKYLKKIYNALAKTGFERYLIIDFGTIREFDYYTGLVFEIYCPEITEKLGSGGRYDGLIKKFGFDVPATGFALDVDLVHKATNIDIRSKMKDIKDIKEILK
jgi:ATP phosphoribosyltransferase regulatory subunit